MGCWVKCTNGFNFIAKKIDTAWSGAIQRINVNKTTANGVLAWSFADSFAIVAELLPELVGKFAKSNSHADLEANFLFIQSVGWGAWFKQCFGSGCDDEAFIAMSVSLFC